MLCCYGEVACSGIVVGFGFGGQDVADRLKQPAVIEPVHTFQGGELDGFQAAPGAATVDHFRLEQADDAFGQCIVLRVANAADRWFDPSLEQLFRIPNAHVLGEAALRRTAVMESLLQGIKNETRVRRSAHAQPRAMLGFG